MGYAYPTSQVDNTLISSCNKALDKRWLDSELGISTRASVLPIDYIRSSGNIDHKQGLTQALQSPSDLSFQAAHMALEQAALKTEQLGLILAECATPVETTPFESQRVGKRLNVKIPAFDVFSGSGAFSLHLDVLRQKQPQSIPDYVLCVSSNTPTQRVDYTTGIEAAYFGDAASALIVSGREPGKLKVLASSFCSDPFGPEAFSIETYGSAHINKAVLEKDLLEQVISVFKTASAELSLKAGTFKLILNFPDPSGARKIAGSLGLSSDSIIEGVSKRGFSFGSSASCALAEYWPRIERADRILVLECSGNLGQGYVLLEAQS